MAAPESAPPPAAPPGPAAAAAPDAAEAGSPAPTAADSSSTVPAASTATDSASAASGLNAAPLLIDASINDELPPLDDPDLDALRDEVYDLIRHIHDPEHPHSLEQLGVVFKAGVQVSRECGPPVSPAARPGTGVDGRSGAVGVGSPGSSMGIAVAVRASSNGAHDDDTADGVGASFVGGVPTEHEVVEVEFKPTVPHCSLATLIGLCIRTKILLTIPHAKLTIRIKEGAHQTADQIEKQLNDKERATAALENPALRDTVVRLIKEAHAYN